MCDLSTIMPFFEAGHDGFCLELHLHTKNASACSSVSAGDMARMYKKAGYDGIVVTDHFLTGNTSVNRELPWDKQIDEFFKGFDEAFEVGKEIGLRVFEGLEYSNHGTDFIVLGLDRDWIKKNQQMFYMEPEEFLLLFKKAGAFIIQAHPFREAHYVRSVRDYSDYVDAIEVVNLGNCNPEWNKKAYELAKRKNMPMTAGSDCHHFGNEFFGAGIKLDHEPKDLKEICEIIGSNKGFSYFGG